MMPEESGSSSPIGAPAETGTQSSSPAPVSPTVSITRTVSESVPVASLDPAAAGALWTAKREELIANPRLADDADWFNAYLGLATRMEGADVEHAFRTEIAQVGPDGLTLRAPGLGPPPVPTLPALSPEAQQATGGWDQTALGALHDIARDSQWPAHVLEDGYQLIAKVAGHGVPSADAGYTALEARWGDQTDTMVEQAQYVVDLLGHDDERAVQHVGTWLAGLSNHPQVTAYLAETIYPLLRDRPPGPLLLAMLGRRGQAWKAGQEQRTADAAAAEQRATQARDAALLEQQQEISRLHALWGDTRTRRR